MKTLGYIRRRRRRYYKANKEKILQRSNEYYKNNKPHVLSRLRRNRRNDPAGAMLMRVKSRADANGIDFNLTREDVVIPKKCPILGISLENSKRVAKRNSPSLDRIDPDLGYIKGNVQIISQMANVMKSDASGEQLGRFARWIMTQTHLSTVARKQR